MWQDIRLAIRGLTAARGFATAAILTLALGIGANAAMFQAAWSLVLRPLPYLHADRLVAVRETGADGARLQVSLLVVEEWQRAVRAFEAIGAYRMRTFGFSRGTADDDDSPRVIQTGMVTSGFFDVLTVRPTDGRVFTSSEERQDVPVILLGADIAAREFGGAGVVGRRVLLNEAPYLVVGILPRTFGFTIGGRIPDAYIPISHRDYARSSGARAMSVMARLKPGVSHDAARSQLHATATRLTRERPESHSRVGADLEDLQASLAGANRRPVALIGSAALLLFLIACTNVASLVVARAAGRSREVAIRAALGATPGRVLRQFCAEGLVISGAGAMVSLAFAWASVRVIPPALHAIGAAGAGSSDITLDWIVVPAIIASACASTLVCAAAPAAIARLSHISQLAGYDASSCRSAVRVRGVFAAAQIAVSVMLLAGAGLLLRSLVAAANTDPGFQPAGVVRFGIGLPEARYDTEPKLIAFHRALLDALRRIPRVAAAGAAGNLPLSGRIFQTSVSVGGATSGFPPPTSVINVVSSGYAHTLGIPIIEGRDFSGDDVAGRMRVALVNETFRKRHFSETSALGRRLVLSWSSVLHPRGSEWEIVGVVGDTHQQRLDVAPQPELYLPLTQFPSEGAMYVIRSDGPLAAAEIARAVTSVDGRLESIVVQPLARAVAASLGPRRLGAALGSGFALLALAVTLVGVYGLASFLASERRREMAIRIAVGAQPREVMRLMLMRAAQILAGGVAVGVAGSASLGVVLSSVLYEVGPRDPLSIVVAACAATAAAGLAALGPARRAARTSPAELLR